LNYSQNALQYAERITARLAKSVAPVIFTEHGCRCGSPKRRITNMRITFLGAAREVTGSMHLIEVNGRRVLLECGLCQGRRAETYERNLYFPFDAASIDAVVLSHAHIDHSGTILNPGLVNFIWFSPWQRSGTLRKLRIRACDGLAHGWTYTHPEQQVISSSIQGKEFGHEANTG
jgi:predicted metal-dependent RNase